ncbi:MAG TPA: glycosyltransferase family 2 protein [Thermoanaerobaculia bacterium]|nr:glycosyltransferase family 2 protein [Thermoanaerobaculia bacterium]
MNDTGAADLAVIVVSWKDARELYEAVASLAAARAAAGSGSRISLTIVVNGETDVRPEEILGCWPGATVVFNRENRGFGPAANQGATGTDAAALLFLNPDTRAEEDSFRELLRGFRAHPEAVALAPRLLDLAGVADPSPSSRLAPPGREDQFTFQLRRLPTLASDARELLLVDHLFPNNPGRRRVRYAELDRGTPFEVEQAAGAALAVRTEAFRRLGGFAEEFTPAWFEDVDLCARLAPMGKVLYWPAARFRHRGGASAEHLGYSRFLPVYYRNALRYRRRHYGVLAQAAYRVLLVKGMLLRLAVLPWRRSDPRPKGESARAYLGVLRVALGFASGTPDRGAARS